MTRRVARAPAQLSAMMMAITTVLATFSPPAHGQRRAPTVVTHLDLDVIGPRTQASIRSALRAHDAELAACRAEEDALVRVALVVAPDGSVLSARAIDDAEADPTATECVIRAATAWRFRARAADGVTTVSWSLSLRGIASDPPPAGRTCWCFHWVHGPDHGLDCATTRRTCEQGRRDRGSSGESTECASSAQPACERDGYVDGQHMHFP